MRTKFLTNPVPLVCVVFLLLLCNIQPVKGSKPHHTEEFARYAVGVLKGVFFDYSKEKAVEILHEAAEQDSMPYAMNALGLIYLEGIGVQKNTTEALYWLEEAGKHGIVDAYHNIGAAYKEGKFGVKQDFTKAYSAFMQGATLGSKVCNYDAGFMLYKGLGCRQNYAKAMEMFEVAADLGHNGARYMLGLCYRNGYGTIQDEDKGLELLCKAADYGYRAAFEELARPYPENYLNNAFAVKNDSIYTPLSMPEIATNNNDVSLLEGDYQGNLIVYDWSGNFILKEIPAKMSVHRKDNELSGIIHIGGHDIPFKADVLDDGTIKFKEGVVSLNERYTTKGKVKYKLNYAKLDIWGDEIKGELALFCLNNKEPEKPMYIQLYRMSNSNRAISRANSISVEPHPSSSVVNVKLNLDETCNVSVRIFDKYGFLVYQREMGVVEKGEQEFSLKQRLKAGYYVLNVTAGNRILRTLINSGGK